MKSRPLLFTPDMAQAIAEGRKTQTRRPTKSQTPPCAVGDQYWVRETWARLYDCPDEYICLNEYPEESTKPHFCAKKSEYVNSPCYKIYFKGEDRFARYPGGWPNDSVPPEQCRWKSPLFMPRAYSRLTLEVLQVREELLQSISHEDVLREGFSAIGYFVAKWQSLYAESHFNWHHDPWVWVITFRVVI